MEGCGWRLKRSVKFTGDRGTARGIREGKALFFSAGNLFLKGTSARGDLHFQHRKIKRLGEQCVNEWGGATVSGNISGGLETNYYNHVIPRGGCLRGRLEERLLEKECWVKNRGSIRAAFRGRGKFVGVHFNGGRKRPPQAVGKTPNHPRLLGPSAKKEVVESGIRSRGLPV